MMEILLILEIIVAVLLVLALIALAVWLFVFWILMIVDAAKRKNITDAEKVVWILVLIFLHILGAIIYYFAVKREKEKNQNKSVKKKRR